MTDHPVAPDRAVFKKWRSANPITVFVDRKDIETPFGYFAAGWHAREAEIGQWFDSPEAHEQMIRFLDCRPSRGIEQKADDILMFIKNAVEKVTP